MFNLMPNGQLPLQYHQIGSTFRDSKRTRLDGDVLGSRSETVMVMLLAREHTRHQEGR